MSASGGTDISSFIIRFIDASPSVDQTDLTYRGVIRHIQTGDEISFTRWGEVTDFIHRFFPIQDIDANSLSDVK